MKKLKECPLLIAVIIFAVVCSVPGIAGAKGIYKEYMKIWKSQPAIAALFQGIPKGIYPWQHDTAEPDGASVYIGSTEKKPEPETEAGTEAVVQETETEAAPKEEDKTYEFTHVDQSYFDDAVFIGDSRIVGMHDYSGWDNATYYASIGLTVYDVFDKPIVEENGTKITVEQALQEHQFKKILVMIGINEMGTGTVDSFMEAYTKMVEHLEELQPDAIIFLHGIMKVKQEKSESDPIFNNPNIQERNDRIAQLADNKRIFYLDVNEVVTDETGNLNPEYTYDEIHLLGKWYCLWTDYLLDHGIVKE